MSDVPTKQWKFDNSTLDYSSHGIIKRQLYYRVFRSIWHTLDKGKLVVAVRENYVREDHTQEQQQEELERLRKLRHPNIVTLLKGLLSDACNVIVLEYPTNGFLDEYLQTQSSLPTAKLYRWSLDIAKALQFLRHQNYIHRGVTSENIIVSNKDVLKVFDLRLAEPYKSSSGTAQDVINLAHLMVVLVTCGEKCKLDKLYLKALSSGKNSLMGRNYACPKVLEKLIMRCLQTETCVDLDEVVDILTKEQTLDLETTPAEIIARGPDAIAAYKKAAQTGTQAVKQTRLMLVGQARVGKTSLKKNIMRERFDINEGVTDGITLHSVCSIDVQHATAWQPRNEDQDYCSLQDQYQQTVTQYIAQSLLQNSQNKTLSDSTNALQKMDEDHGKIMKPIIQPSKRTSTDDTDNIHGPQTKFKPANTDEDTTTNQSDDIKDDGNMAEMVVVPKEIYERVITRMEDNVEKEEEDKDEITLSIWDFAGHELYYTTHQVFLSRRAVFLVVFNLSGDLHGRAFVDHQGEYEIYQLELTRLEFLDFWMRSIYTFAARHNADTSPDDDEDVEQLSPPIFIVGTHKNSLGKTLKERKQLIRRKFETIRKFIRNKCYRKHIVSRFYAVENSLQDDEDKEVKKLPGAKDTSDEELTTLLQFYHDLGQIIYIGDSSPALRNLVILDPKWLIDVFKAVINVVDWEDRRGVDIDAWTRLEEEGIIEEKLIKRMWKDIVGTGQEADVRKTALLDLMEKFDLLCEKVTSKQTSNPNGGKMFYVPSRLQPVPSADNNTSNPSGSKSSSTVFYVDFQEFLPDGIFRRLLARSARWSQEQGGLEPQLHYRHATFYADAAHEFELEMTPHREARIKVTVSRAKVAGLQNCRASAGQRSSPKTTMKVKQFLLDTLADLKATWARGLQYKLCLTCPCTAQPLHYLDLDQCLKEDLVPCCKSHRVNTREIQIQLGGRITRPEDKNMQATEAILSDQFLMQLSEKMDERWEFLATSQLGFTRENLVHIKHDNLTMVAQIHTMLVNWRQRQPRYDVMQAVNDLYKALDECGRKDLAEVCSALLD